MLHIAICDDEQIIMEQLKKLLEAHRPDCIVTMYLRGEGLLDTFNQYDLVFLDIEMPNSSGIDTAKVIREYDKNVIIIFISSHSEFVFDTFDCETFNFITKPINKEKFSNVINMAVLKYKRNNAYFVITKAHESIKLPIDKIKYAECYKKYFY